jgi:hypothetical protein
MHATHGQAGVYRGPLIFRGAASLVDDDLDDDRVDGAVPQLPRSTTGAFLERSRRPAPSLATLKFSRDGRNGDLQRFEGFRGGSSTAEPRARRDRTGRYSLVNQN